ncbi:hypothetical protein [Bacillus sp. SM2101]|uniref:hypothetical protein n=1 Tax=Bacillus sp. SM2101 TaxID=2805366 RepID=UPI001BDE60DC|nr:hypothetical protein [Bacillus sp. SM2101]
MKKMIGLLLILIAVLTSCSNENNSKNVNVFNGEEEIEYEHIFSGEGQYWKGEVIITGTSVWEDEKERYDHERSEEFIINYIGEFNDLSQINTLTYTYETSNGSVGRTLNNLEITEPLSEDAFNFNYSSKSESIVQEDEVIKVTVKWDQFEEVFDLININN